MINISLERAIEELVDMMFTKRNVKVLVYCSRQNKKNFYLSIYHEAISYITEKHIKSFHNTYDYRHNNYIEFHHPINKIEFYTENEDLRSKRYDLVLIDTKIDPKFHDEIRLSLRQNSVIPKEKQIQFFDIEEDKVWFEDEYQRELYERWRDDFRLTHNMAMGTDWIRKQCDSTIKYKQIDEYDSMLTSKYVLQKIVENIDSAIYQNLFTEDKREDEEPMEMKITVEKSREDLTYAYTITDIEILKVLNKETGVEEPKVTKITFVDGTSMKMVCHEEDTFDLRRCLFIAIAKKLYKERYTWEGIEHKATELSYLKSVTKVVDKALKDFNNKIKEAEKEAKKIADKKRAAENQKRKHAEYVKRRDERRQKEIDEKNRQQFEYDVAVQVEAARRIEEMYRETNYWECE